MNIYDFTVKAQDGSGVSLSNYKGKVLLVVNTATGCGFTPQYNELQDNDNEFKDRGLEILDFPAISSARRLPEMTWKFIPSAQVVTALPSHSSPRWM